MKNVFLIALLVFSTALMANSSGIELPDIQAVAQVETSPTQVDVEALGYNTLSTEDNFKKLILFKNKSYLCSMETKRNKCIVGGKLGTVINSYTHTKDVYLFKEKRTMYGVHRKYVKMLPNEKLRIDEAQLRINFG